MSPPPTSLLRAKIILQPLEKLLNQLIDNLLELDGKIVRHSPKLKLLGNMMTDNLSWATHINQIVLPAIRNSVRTLRLTAKYLDNRFKAMYTNAIYRSRLLFAIETWGGADKSLLSKVQSLQNQASKIASGNCFPWDSARR